MIASVTFDTLDSMAGSGFLSLIASVTFDTLDSMAGSGFSISNSILISRTGPRLSNATLLSSTLIER